MIHLTPIWFDWDGSVFRLSLGAGRVHLRNLAANPRVTILVDEDPRLQHGLAAGAWAIECRGTGVTVNAILPSIIDTRSNRAMMPDRDRSKWVNPNSIAQLILYLASEAAAEINGALIPIYGEL